MVNVKNTSCQRSRHVKNALQNVVSFRIPKAVNFMVCSVASWTFAKSLMTTYRCTPQSISVKTFGGGVGWESKRGKKLLFSDIYCEIPTEF